ncbi:hypothetical protein [Stenotrophomonas oahuensis]|uniref:TIGR04086 family membrane protein n=1 Tax=Stenotrophomonas oahuensis TaxID=3003271 RepID=A0ABY9YK34_9GAMM|nr:hypothetical protein [Stenotrophomonas sp. A5586]WNH51252.1 hypothetical protein PDM29_12845 [Stenotrophomonas sp. A5586]
MGRQITAFLLVVGLNIAVAVFLGVSVVAKSVFVFARADALAYLCGLWIALLAGWISRRYGFALAVAGIHLGFGLLAAHFVAGFTEAGFVQAVSANSLNFAVFMLTGVVGACIGVLLSQLNGARGRRARSVDRGELS